MTNILLLKFSENEIKIMVEVSSTIPPVILAIPNLENFSFIFKSLFISFFVFNLHLFGFHLIVLLMEYISSSCPSCGIHFSDISFFITFCVFSLFFSGYRCVVLDSGVFHLLSEVGPGVYAGLLVGGTDACPVELSWVLSSGVSMGVFRNICFFRI